MHAVITGGRGFIGKALHEELMKADWRVSILDWWDPITFQPDPAKDLSQPGVFASQMDAFLGHDRVDVVIHLAAQVGRLNGENDIRHTILTNALMTGLIAKYCGAYGIRLAYASTSEVYGDQGNKICYEEGPFALPHNLYGLSKRWGEEICQLYAPEGLVIFRPSMPYGPGVPPGRGRRALDNFLWQACTGQSIPVHIGAERSWCWIGDLVRGMHYILEETASAGAWNVGRDDDPRSLFDCALHAVRLAGARTEQIVTINPPENQTTVKRLSTDKLRELGWRPTVDFDEGMIKLYEWIRRYNIHGEYIQDPSQWHRPLNATTS